MPLKWSEVAAKPEFQRLQAAEQEAARQQYFDEVVAPRVGETDREEARRQFDADTFIRKQDLPAGVKPSAAGGGRGRSAGMRAEDAPLAAPAPSPRAAPAPRAAALPAVAEAPAVDPMGTPTAGAIAEGGADVFARSDRSILEDPNPFTDPLRHAPGDLEVLAAQNVPPQVAAERARRARMPVMRATEAGDGRALEPIDRRQSFARQLIAPGGVVDAAKEAPGMALRGLGESALKAGAVMADMGITLPGGPNAREYRQAAAPLAKSNAQASARLSDEAIADLGPLLRPFTPSARTVAEGMSEVGRQVVLNMVVPGGIVVDAGFRGADDALMAGMSPGAALLVGTMKAATEGVPEHLSARFAMKEGAGLRFAGLLSDPKIAVDAVKRFGKSMGIELTSEQASAVSGWAVDRITNDPTATLDRLGRDMVDAVRSTVVQAPGMMAAGKLGQVVVDGVVARKITPYDIAAQRGFNVEPPLTTDDPVTLIKRRVSTFQNVAAQYGIPEPAVKRAVETAKTLQADQVGPFLKDLVGALRRREVFTADPDPAIVDTLAAAPVEPPAETGGASGATKSAARETTEAPRETADAAVDRIGSLLGIDEAAHAAATSPTNELPEPTDAQKEAGNYQKGHAKLAGLDLSIENPAGSIRRSKADAPKQWQTEMRHHYGYVRRTEGADGDQVDVFVKPGTASDYDGPVFVVDQRNRDGSFDEHKAMLGFATEDEAREAYLSNYEKGWTGLQAITPTTVPDFKAWLNSDGTKQPFAREGTTDVQGAVAAPVDGVGSAGRDAQPERGAEPASLLPAVPEQGRAPAAARGPEGSGAAPAAARDAGGKPTGALRVVARVGRMPNSAEPITLQPNDDGTLTPVLGRYEMVDFDTGEPIVLKAGVTDDEAIDAIRAAGALSKSMKVFREKTEGTAAATPAAEAAAPAPAAPASAPEPAEQPAKKPARQGAAQKRGSAERNPFKAFLGRHGVSLDLGKEFAPGQAERRSAMVPGYGPIFRRSGLQLDELAQRAAEDGFLPPGSEDVDALYELIADVMRGERIIPAYSPEAVQAEAEARAQREMEDAELAALELEALADDELRSLDELWNDEAPPQSTADAMRALGFTEQEIADATAAERREGQATDQGDRGAAAPAAERGEAGAARSDAGPRADEARTDEGLTSPTPADLKAGERRRTAAERDAAKQQKQLADKAKADAERGEFTLTGSDRPADVAAAAGQRDIFDAPAAPAREPAAKQPSAEAQASAFADDFAALAGRTLVQQIQIVGSDRTATVRIDAAVAMRNLARRERVLRELRDCIGKAA